MADHRRNRRPATDGDRERRGSDGGSHRTRDRDSGRDRERGDRGDHNDRSRRHRSRYHDKDSNQDSRDRDRARNDDRDRDRDRDRDVDLNRRDRDRDRKRRERDYDHRGDFNRSDRRRSASPARRSGSPALIPPSHSRGGGPNKNLRRPMKQGNDDEDVDDDEGDDELGLLRNGRHTGLPNRTRARELAGSDVSTLTPSTAAAPMSFRVGRSDRRGEAGGRDGNRKPYDSRDENGSHEELDYGDRRYLEDDTSRENEAEDDIEVDDDGMDAMQAMMGFGSFASTKGTKVAGNNAGAVRKVKRTEYRQYMNRQGGFNRPLSPSR
ncbi:hypothetical protein SEPCBS57363_004142 [Sporothrix epigloea]|uniref:U4/U6.U5 small nuclear ribonucleoprotein 27kDa protein domain-containing protein n=1 Tax=Sporothrix epigloea TaxID=1892477 RepID=A0ABP0DQH1_9PEZI